MLVHCLALLSLSAQLLVSGAAVTKRGTDCSHPESLPLDEPIMDCPHKKTIDKKGECPIDEGPCKPGYCEVKITVSAGAEVPFDNSRCQANDPTCDLAQAKAVTTTTSLSINVELGGTGKPDKSALESAFSAGASYSFSKSIAYTTTNTHKKPEDQKSSCGYWTFVPYYVESCGSLTLAHSQFSSAGTNAFQSGSNCVKDKTIGNWCNKTPLKNDDGKSRGAVVYVLVDCKTNKRLEMAKQDPIYQKPGVANKS